MVVDYSWFLGFGVMFGLSFVLTYTTYQDLETFFSFLTIFSGFVVWAGLLDLWVLILNIIILTIILLSKTRGRL